MEIVEAHHERFIPDVRAIFIEYQAWLGFDLCFQGFDGELNNLPGDYRPPSGRLYLAVEKEDTAGSVALRKLKDDVCEMKRLYVRPAFRGRGLGKDLAKAVIRAAREVGYAVMKLDTLPSMSAAIGLYKSLGFVETDAYRYNPIEGTKYMVLDLRTR